VLLRLALGVVGAKLAGELTLGILLGNLALLGGPDVSAIGEGAIFVVLVERAA
jgi:hypothetical protein